MPAAIVTGIRYPEDVAADDHRERAPAPKPALGPIDPARRDVQEGGQPVLEEGSSEAAGEQVEVAGAGHDHGGEDQPDQDQVQQRVGEVAAQVENQEVPGDRDREAGLLQVEREERGE